MRKHEFVNDLAHLAARCRCRDLEAEVRFGLKSDLGSDYFGL